MGRGTSRAGLLALRGDAKGAVPGDARELDAGVEGLAAGRRDRAPARCDERLGQGPTLPLGVGVELPVGTNGKSCGTAC